MRGIGLSPLYANSCPVIRFGNPMNPSHVQGSTHTHSSEVVAIPHAIVFWRWCYSDLPELPSSTGEVSVLQSRYSITFWSLHTPHSQSAAGEWHHCGLSFFPCGSITGADIGILPQDGQFWLCVLPPSNLTRQFSGSRSPSASQVVIGVQITGFISPCTATHKPSVLQTLKPSKIVCPDHSPHVRFL